jgi:hypothetical protein
MSKKHFIALASAFATRRAEIVASYKGKEQVTRLDEWKANVEAVAGVCRAENAAFDLGRFLTACEGK